MKVLMAIAGLGLGALAARPRDAAPDAGRGRVSGRISVELPGVKLDDLLPLVVYLDAPSGRLSYPVPAEIPVISQKDARFTPSFLAVAAGQTVALVNDDRIVHNVFSYSPPKQFDLGLYPAGETRKVTFDKPGVTDLFCSIHSKMNATVFVAPSPYFMQVPAGGTFDLARVPPGKYLLKGWSRKFPIVEREIEVTEGGVTEVSLVLRGESR